MELPRVNVFGVAGLAALLVLNGALAVPAGAQEAAVARPAVHVKSRARKPVPGHRPAHGPHPSAAHSPHAARSVFVRPPFARLPATDGVLPRLTAQPVGAVTATQLAPPPDGRAAMSLPGMLGEVEAPPLLILPPPLTAPASLTPLVPATPG